MSYNVYMDTSLQIRLSAELHRAAKIQAAKTGIPMAEICRQALEKWVAEDELPQQEQPEEPGRCNEPSL